MRKLYYATAILLAISTATLYGATPGSSKRNRASLPYSYGQKVGVVEDMQLNEISGMAPSSYYDECFWVHNDSGDAPNVYLINLSGELIATLELPATNRDWESIATADGYIYIGETGDNNAAYPDKKIFKVEEPKGIDIKLLGQKLSVSAFETMTFNFADGQRDCETLMFDPFTGELVLVSKREDQVRIYTTPFISTAEDEIRSIKLCTTLNLTQATSGDISSCGGKILIKNYLSIYYWSRDNHQTLAEAFAAEPTVLAYDPEPQGEAIAWSSCEDAFYTVSEMVGDNFPVIYRYNCTKK